MQTIASYSLIANLLSQVLYDQVVHLKFNSKNVKVKLINSLPTTVNSKFIIAANYIANDTIEDIPVFVTLLDELDYKFRHQSPLGLPIDHEFAVFSARAMNLNQVVFSVKLIDENEMLLASAKFTLAKAVASSQSQGVIKVSLVNGLHEVASIVLDYLVILPFIPYDTSIESWMYSGHEAVAWKNRAASRSTVHSGHRGLGVGTRNNLSGCDSVCENTIASFNYACESGGQMVELDVSLTKDKVVQVYHDLQLIHKPTSQIYNIRDVNYEDILSHEYHPIDHGNGSKLELRNESNPDLTLFPKLRQVLKSVHSQCAINVEVKYPYPVQDGQFTWNPHNPFDLNEYVDRILTEVLIYAGNREIVFSSFSPDVCSALRLKQRKYPVLQLTRNSGGPPVTPSTRDPRFGEPEIGLLWANASDLEGVNSYGQWVLEGGLQRVDLIRKKLNLVLYAWQGPLTVSEINRLIDYDLDGLCYDLIDLKIGSTKKRRRGSPEIEGKNSKLDNVTLANRQNLITTFRSLHGSSAMLQQESNLTSVDLFTTPVKGSTSISKLIDRSVSSG